MLLRSFLQPLFLLCSCFVVLNVCVCVYVCVCVCVAQNRTQGRDEGKNCDRTQCCTLLHLSTDRKTSRTALLFLRSFLSPLFLLCSCFCGFHCVCVCVPEALSPNGTTGAWSNDWYVLRDVVYNQQDCKCHQSLEALSPP